MLITISNGPRFVVRILRITREDRYRYICIKWMVGMCVLMILQYSYNIYHHCDCENIKEKYNFTKEHHRWHQRVMSYTKFKAIYRHNVNLVKNDEPVYKERTPICHLDTRSLGAYKVNKTAVTLEWVNSQVRNVKSGFSSPKSCRPRYRIAILIPYRDRATNLAIFLYHIHPFLQKQLLQYRVFVIEQTGKERKFNKGALYNVGFIETQRFGHWDCLIFHDVDLIPLSEKIIYTCPNNPTHFSAGVEPWNFTLPYSNIFGGVTVLNPRHYLKVNGYSNSYWNWGGEDDDMFERLRAAGLAVFRLDTKVAKYAVLPHKLQIANELRFLLLKLAKRRYKYEGLDSLQYRLIEIVRKDLFIHILADVNPFNYNT